MQECRVAAVYPREVVRRAMELNAAAVILFHSITTLFLNRYLQQNQIDR